jgi:hypothetical protein
MYRKKQIKLIALKEHTQQIGSRHLGDKAVRMLFAVTVCALRERLFKLAFLFGLLSQKKTAYKCTLKTHLDKA